MRFSGRPIRGSLAVAVFLVTGITAGLCSQQGGGSHALHEKKHDAKRQVEALEDVWRTAQLSSDVATMDKLLSDDYIGISMTGQVYTKAQQLDRMRSHKFVVTKLELGEMQVKLVGISTAISACARCDPTATPEPSRCGFRLPMWTPLPAA